MRRPVLLALLLLALPASAFAAPAPRLEPALASLAREAPEATVVAWVFFTDRAGAERDPSAFAAARATLTRRSLDRRLRRGSVRDVVASDLPVHEAYWRALVARGAKLRGTSRWLNAASVELSARLAAEVATFPFVGRVERVAAGRVPQPVGPPEPVAEAPASKAVGAEIDLGPGDQAWYGGAWKQMAMMQVPQLHAAGLSGAGVLVAMLDSGFHTTHQAVASIPIVARRDFVHGDLNVDDETGEAGAATHGTATFAAVGGHFAGAYAAAAYGASFALGKTEDVFSEKPVEMDYWQFGAEWADSLGADVISSSLGYSTFDSPFPSYTYADMDGRTTVVTLAAVEAMRRGITVVTAAGNEGAKAWHFLIAPGDADSIVTSGAVDSNNVIASFSSRGPTSDGRIKPDVTAMGVKVLTIPTTSDSTYTRLSGTSLSTPLTAGVVALLLEAHPTWRPIDVVDALHATALNHATPDNDIGWGLLQAYDASQWSPVTGVPAPPRVAANLELHVGPNPLRTGESARIAFAAPAGRATTIDLVDVAGRARARLFAGAARGVQTVAWNGRDDAGSTLAPGVYWLRLAVAGVRESRTVPVVVLR